MGWSTAPHGANRMFFEQRGYVFFCPVNFKRNGMEKVIKDYKTSVCQVIRVIRFLPSSAIATSLAAST